MTLPLGDLSDDQLQDLAVIACHSQDVLPLAETFSIAQELEDRRFFTLADALLRSAVR